MIKVEEIRNFVSGNFKGAVLSGKITNDKVDLKLKLNDSENVSSNYMHIYNENLEELKNNPRELLNYLLDKYLENNTIIGVQYFANVQNHSDKTSFVISGVNSSFIISLRQDCMCLLPDKFVEKVEFEKRKGILKVLSNVEINKIVLHNFDQTNIGRDYRTGLRRDTIEEGVYHYDALRIQNSIGKPINYDGEKEFVFKALELLCERGTIDYEKLKLSDETFKFGYYDRTYDYKLNDKISVNGNMNADLFVFREFLAKFMDDYNDDVKNNQMRLVLNRKVW